jgi:hypothetical protein
MSSNHSISWFLDRLEDPFTLFPIEGVADMLAAALDAVQSRRDELGGHYGASRKYWSVKQENSHDEAGLLIGSIFVLGQTAIAQSVSILTQLSHTPLLISAMPKQKAQLMRECSALFGSGSYSTIEVINAVSNYFKHAYEWPDDWDTDPAKGVQADTIKIVMDLGMRPGDLADNLDVAAQSFGLSTRTPRAIATSIGDWRSAWARRLYKMAG